MKDIDREQVVKEILTYLEFISDSNNMVKLESGNLKFDLGMDNILVYVKQIKTLRLSYNLEAGFRNKYGLSPEEVHIIFHEYIENIFHLDIKVE